MRKIAIFKTIRITSMGNVINETKKKFPNSDIIIISPSKNSKIYSLFDDVKVIHLDCEPINPKKTDKNILSQICDESFDLAIIPTEGNFHTYDNVINFTNNFLSKSEIFYYIFPDSFINYNDIKKNNIFLYLINMISFVSSLFFLFVMIPILIGKSLFNLIWKSR